MFNKNFVFGIFLVLSLCALTACSQADSIVSTTLTPRRIYGGITIGTTIAQPFYNTFTD